MDSLDSENQAEAKVAPWRKKRELEEEKKEGGSGVKAARERTGRDVERTKQQRVTEEGKGGNEGHKKTVSMGSEDVKEWMCPSCNEMNPDCTTGESCQKCGFKYQPDGRERKRKSKIERERKRTGESER